MARSLLQLVQAACGEMSLAQPSTVFGNQDKNIAQLLALAQREGKDCSGRANSRGGWSALRKDWTFNMVPSQVISSGSAAGNVCTITTATAHGLSIGNIVNVWGATPSAYNGTFILTGATSTTFTYTALSSPSGVMSIMGNYAVVYSVPSDYGWMVPQTIWDSNFRWQMLGPLSAQEWNVLQYGISPVGPRMRFQIRGGLVYLNPAPGTTQTDLVALTYISANWCQSAALASQNLWAADTDTYLLDEDLFIMGLQWRFKKAKGFVYDDLQDDYEDRADMLVARDGGMRSLPLNADSGDLSLLSSANVPDTGFGATT
jgi:hypothetical protein